MADWDRPFDASLVGTEDVLVLTETEEDSMALLDVLSDCGCVWAHGMPLREESYWAQYSEDTAYCVKKDKRVQFGSRTKIDRENYIRLRDHIRCTFNALPDLVPLEGATADGLLV